MTRGAASRARTCRASSSRSSPPRGSARGRGSASPSRTASSPSTAAGSRSRARWGRGAGSRSSSRDRPSPWRRRRERPRPGRRRRAGDDARAARTGLFVQAHRGTLLLDEIGDLPLALQPKLLRALQERVVRPVGGNEEISFDVRLVATTNRDIESAIDEDRFREDLFFRVNVIHVAMPPLRARGSDVLLLAQHFLVHHAGKAGKRVGALSPEAAERLLAYAWPGNVRELQNAMERAVALTQYEQVMVDDLPEKIRAYRPSHVLIAADDPSELVPLEEAERRYILRVLESVGGNKTLAARVLGIGRKTLYRKLEQYGVAGG